MWPYPILGCSDSLKVTKVILIKTQPNKKKTVKRTPELGPNILVFQCMRKDANVDEGPYFAPL